MSNSHIIMCSASAATVDDHDHDRLVRFVLVDLLPAAQACHEARRRGCRQVVFDVRQELVIDDFRDRLLRAEVQD